VASLIYHDLGYVFLVKTVHAYQIAWNECRLFVSPLS